MILFLDCQTFNEVVVCSLYSFCHYSDKLETLRKRDKKTFRPCPNTDKI